MRTRTRVLWYVSAFGFLSGMSSVGLIADEPEPARDLIPANLKKWTIEYRAIGNGGASQVVTLKQDGTYRFRWGNRPVQVGDLGDDAALIFDQTREIFNRYHIRRQRGETNDLALCISIRVPSGCGMTLKLDPIEFNSLGIGVPLQKVCQIFVDRGFDWFRSFDRFVNGIRPKRADSDDRYPDRTIAVPLRFGHIKPRSPDQYLCHEFSTGSWLHIDEKGLLFRLLVDEPVEINGKTYVRNKIAAETTLPLTESDSSYHDTIVRQILNRFQLQSENSGDHKTKPRLFEIDTGLSMICDRQTLIDAGVLDDLDAWAKDINRRFEEQGFKERFAPPWAE